MKTMIKGQGTVKQIREQGLMSTVKEYTIVMEE
jgi:hypothetical protein